VQVTAEYSKTDMNVHNASFSNLEKNKSFKKNCSMGLSCDPPFLFHFYVLLLITFTKFTFDEYQMLWYYFHQHLIMSCNAFLVQMFFSIPQLYQNLLDVWNQNGVKTRKRANKIRISETLN